MFNRKKEAPPKKRSRDLSQYGIFDYSEDFDATMNDMEDDGDSDLEAELAAITAGGGAPKPKAKPKLVVPPSELDKMVAESMKDIGSDEELSGDDDDPDLLGELQELTGEEVAVEEEAAPQEDGEEPEQVFLPTTTVNIIEIIKTRIQMYEAAEANAKEAGESSRARRFNRGLKTLRDMLKQATAGKSINVDDIPPEVFVKGAKPAADGGNEETPAAPTRTAPSPPKSPPVATPPVSPPKSPTPPSSPPPSSPPPSLPPPSSPPAQSPVEEKPVNPKVAMLNARKQEYKKAALTAKHSGDHQTALQFVKVIKQFDVVIKMAEEGKEIDLSDMPPPPEQFLEFMAQMQAAASQQPEPAPVPEQPPPAPEPAESSEGLVTAGTLLEALQQRLEKYQSVEAAAKAEGNSGKARRFGRIVKQYQDAIKLHKAGKPVPLDELPTPPGFGPLPTENAAPRQAPPPPPRTKPATPPAEEEEEEKPASATSSPDKPTPPPRAKPQTHNSTSTRISGNQVTTSLAEKQMQLLLERQKEFKNAAIEAKKAGELEQAKEYLKIYKGFESVLNAASGGLPVDMSTLPIPPSQRENLEDSFAVVTTDECDPSDDISDLSVRLEEQLAKQLMMCKNTRDHHKAMGDVAGTNRFENLALTVQKDLDFVRFLRRKNMPVPKFHYEKKSFNIVHCNTDLTENEVEINVVRGISYNVPNPKDVDTYVKVEFPYPQDYPYKNKTSLVKNTDSPDYDQKFVVEIQRSNRQCQRLFKRQAVKFEIYSRGGFLRSDILIGTVNVKLQPLETKCDIHDSYELMDGRKKVGGKLEVKLRIRKPILTNQIEHIDEKWLIIDH